MVTKMTKEMTDKEMFAIMEYENGLFQIYSNRKTKSGEFLFKIHPQIKKQIQEDTAKEIFDELENNKFIDLRNRGEGIYAKIMSLKQRFFKEASEK